MSDGRVQVSKCLLDVFNIDKKSLAAWLKNRSWQGPKSGGRKRRNGSSSGTGGGSLGLGPTSAATRVKGGSNTNSAPLIRVLDLSSMPAPGSHQELHSRGVSSFAFGSSSFTSVGSSSMSPWNLSPSFSAPLSPPLLPPKGTTAVFERNAFAAGRQQVSSSVLPDEAVGTICSSFSACEMHQQPLEDGTLMMFEDDGGDLSALDRLLSDTFDLPDELQVASSD